MMTRIEIKAPAQPINCKTLFPSSKSMSNRASIINSKVKGTHPLENLSECDDTQVMIRALQASPDETIDIMAAGTAMRFLTAYLSVTPGKRIITGTKRMQQRPIQVLVNALRELGAKIDYMANEGFPPLQITGSSLNKGSIQLPGNISSQYISALLMIAPTLTNGLTIQLSGEIISRPYIQLTLQLMNDFGANAYWGKDDELRVEPQPYQSIPYYIESDWSAASYWYQIAALAPEAKIILPGLKKDSYQGDSQVSELFHQLGVETTYQEQGVILSKGSINTQYMEYDFVNQPDLAQTFVVTCALLGIHFRFTGLQSLKIKETDRITALVKEMKKLGYIIKETDNSILSWEGELCSREEEAIDTYEDHRMAMAFAPASLKLSNIFINHPQVVSKSYPRYWENLQTAGFIIKEV